MRPARADRIPPSDLWKRAREGDLRGSVDAARRALDELAPTSGPSTIVDLHLVIAFCSMRGGDYAEATRVLNVAASAAGSPDADRGLVLRVEAWCAELAYFQGRYSAAKAIVDRLVDRLEVAKDWAYAAFAMRIRIAILLARADYDGIATEAARAIRNAQASGDDYARRADPERPWCSAFRLRNVEVAGTPRTRPPFLPRPARHAADKGRGIESARVLRGGAASGRAGRLCVRCVVRLGQHRTPSDSAGERSRSDPGDTTALAHAPATRRQIRRDRHPFESRLGPAHARTVSGSVARARRRARPRPRNRHVQRAPRVPRVRSLHRSGRVGRHGWVARELSPLPASRQGRTGRSGAANARRSAACHAEARLSNRTF